MPTRSRHPKTDAILEQLRSEIAAVPGGTVKGLSDKMGIDYWTLRRYVNGEREMPLDVLSRALEALGVDYRAFLDRAALRQETPPTH